jgi:transposase-like protein
MVTVTLWCSYCESEKLVRNGHVPNGKQRYFCQECKRYNRENPSSRGYSEERKEEILRAYQERSSLRGLERTFGVSFLRVCWPLIAQGAKRVKSESMR